MLVRRGEGRLAAKSGVLVLVGAWLAVVQGVLVVTVGTEELPSLVGSKR